MCTDSWISMDQHVAIGMATEAVRHPAQRRTVCKPRCTGALECSAPDSVRVQEIITSEAELAIINFAGVLHIPSILIRRRENMNTNNS